MSVWDQFNQKEKKQRHKLSHRDWYYWNVNCKVSTTQQSMDENKYDEFIEENISVDQLQQKNENKKLFNLLLIRIRQKNSWWSW